MVLSDSPVPPDINPLNLTPSHTSTSSSTNSLNEYNTPLTSVETRESLFNTRSHNTASSDTNPQNNPNTHNNSTNTKNNSNNNNSNIMGFTPPLRGNTFNIDIVIAISDYNLPPHKNSFSPTSPKMSPQTTFRSASVSTVSTSSTAYYSHNTNNNNDDGSEVKNKLSFHKGDTIYVLNKLPTGWWDGIVVQYLNYSSHYNYNTSSDSDFKIIRGWFPNTFIKPFRENVSCIFKREKNKNENLNSKETKNEDETIVINLPIPVTNKYNNNNNNINNFILGGNGPGNSRKNSSGILFSNYSRNNSIKSFVKHLSPNNEPSIANKRGSIFFANHARTIDDMMSNDDNMYFSLSSGRKPSIKSSVRSDSKSDINSVENKNEKIKN